MNSEAPPRKVLIYGPWRFGPRFSKSRATLHPQWGESLKHRVILAAKTNCEERLHTCWDKLTSHETGIIYINEYTQGTEQLKHHIDSTKMFDELIVGISLGAPCVFNFVQGHESIDVHLPSRSAYFIT